EAPQPDDEVATSVARALTASGVAKDVADALVLELANAAGADDPLGLMTLVVDRLRSSPPERPKKTRASAKATEEQKPLASDDLRSIVAEGRRSKRSAYDALLAAGVV